MLYEAIQYQKEGKAATRLPTACPGSCSVGCSSKERDWLLGHIAKEKGTHSALSDLIMALLVLSTFLPPQENQLSPFQQQRQM